MSNTISESQMCLPALLKVAYFFLCVAGTVLSLYAYYVESSITEDESYEPLCDVSPHISCSAVLTSKYSTGMGIVGSLLGEDNILNFSNAAYGIILYVALLGAGRLLALFPGLITLLVLGQTVVVVAGLFLMYLLYVVLEDFCLLCTSIHVINILIWGVMFSMYCRYRGQSRPVAKKQQ